MKSKAVIVSAILCVLVTALWYSRVYQPTKDSAATAREEAEQIAHVNQGLEGEVAQLKALASNGPETEIELAKLHQALPESPELASFIRIANTMAEETHIDWVSVAPTEPVVTGQVATIALNIQVKGGYFEVLDYLTRIEALPRLLVIDSVSISSSGTSAASTPGAPAAPIASPGDDSFGGAPELSVTLAARMFTTAGVPAVVTPVPGAVVPPGTDVTPTTTSTDVPAN